MQGVFHVSFSNTTAAMQTLNLDPTKMQPGAIAGFQKKMREQELKRMEAEANRGNEEVEERGSFVASDSSSPKGKVITLRVP